MSEHTTEDTINRLKALTEKLCLVQDRITIDHAVIEIQNAIAERDEARREVCEFELVNRKQAHEYATYRGWHCYKEEP